MVTSATPLFHLKAHERAQRQLLYKNRGQIVLGGCNFVKLRYAGVRNTILSSGVSCIRLENFRHG